MKKTTTGFTIVELLIVIVVIAILAAISVAAYTGIQNRANDAKMKAGVVQIEKALRLWVEDYGLPIVGGLNSTVGVSDGRCADGMSGWFGSTSYICTVEDALVSANYLPQNFTHSLPNNPYYASSITTGRLSTMLYRCRSDSRYALFWTLRNPSAEDTASINNIVSICGNTNPRDAWGMRSAKMLEF